jgi:hypothetical protein
MPPGLTVSWQPTQTPPPVRAELARPRSPPLTLTLTVVLCPASRRPEAGATDRLPIRPEDSVMDHDTGPPEAVSLRLAPDSALSTIVLGATLSVPGGGGGGGAVVRLADGDGLGRGDGLWLGDGLRLDGRAEGEGEGPPPAGVVAPAAGEGDTRAAALAVAFAELPGLPGLPELPGPLDWLPGTAPPDGAGPAPADDVPWLSALSWPWWVPNAPVSARMVSTPAAATTAATAAPCIVRACRHAGFGGSSGLGKPPGPDMTARCATLAR